MALFSFATSLTMGAGSATAATCTAVDQTTYNACIASAASGDTVVIPVGVSVAQNATPINPITIQVNSGGTLSDGTGGFGAGTTNLTINAGGAVSTLGVDTFASLSGAGTLTTPSLSAVVFGNGSSTSFSGTWVAPDLNTSLVKQGTGALTINGMTAANGDFLETQGSLLQSGGTTNIKSIAVGTGTGNSAGMTVSGGTLNFTGTGLVGFPCASQCPALRIGDFGGTGVFTQTAGTVVIGAPGVAGSMNIGNQGGNGTYNMSGGVLQLGVLGDVNSAGLYSIGRQATANPAFANSTGNFNISGTALVDVQAGELINGDRDAGGAAGALTSSTITQTGGTLRVHAGANLWLSAFDNGNAIDSVYNLNGGTLEIGDGRLQAGYGGGTGAYQFNIGGGTIKVIDSALVTSVNAILTNSAGLTLDTNGLGATWNGLLSGPGALTKTGSGTLLLGNVNTYAGATNINVGTLQAGVANALSTSTAVTVASGATFTSLNLTQNIGSLAGSGTVQLGTSGFIVTGYDNTNTAFSGTVFESAQNGALAKVGTGTWNISGMTIAEGEFYDIQGTLAQSSGSTSIKYLAVGTGAGNSANMTVSGGTLNITGNFAGSPPCASGCPSLQVGDFGGTGVLTQTAGTVIIGAPGVAGSMNIGNQGGNGTYNMSGGVLQLGVLGDVNSAGLYSIGRQATGNPAFANSTGNFNISGTALVDVQAGELINGDRDAGGAAGAVTSSTITQTGGTLRVHAGANLWLSAFNNGAAVDSIYNLNGGTIEIGDGRLQANYGGGGGAYQFNLGNGTIKVIDAALVTSVDGILTGGTAATGVKIDTNGFGATWNGILSGTGWIVKTGLGTLSLGGVNTYTGGTAFNGGVVFVDVGTDLGATTAAMSFNGGTLQLGANGVLSTRIGGTNMAGAGTIDTNGFSTFYDGTVSGPGALTKIGAGTLDFGGSNNAWTGALNVNQGTFLATFGNAIGDTSAVTVASGAFLTVGNISGSETIGSLAGAGTTTIANGSTLTTGGNNTSTVWSGTLNESGGPGKLTKVGTGTMTVNGNLSYTGLTTINGGIFLLNGTSADSVVVNSGATFGGNSTINGNLTVNAGAHLSPGNSPGSTIVVGNYTGGGVFDAQVQFNNAGAPVNGTTHDYLQIGGNVAGTTLINVVAIAPSNAPTATTGNGIELVQVDGAVTSSQFALAAPVFQGGYQYVLNYMQNFSGVHDGFFLQSVVRDELWGQVAALSAGQAMTDRCFRGGDRASNGEGEDRRGRAWASAVTGSLSTGANTGVDTKQDYTCGVGGIDVMTGENVRVGLQGGYGNSTVDVQTPGGVGKLDGNQGAIEAYAVYAKEHLFVNLSAGYATTDWTFDAPISGQSSATISGMIASAQGGMRWPMGNLRLGVLAQIDYDGTSCGSSCFIAGASEQTSQWLAKGSLRLDGRFSDGTILPYAALSIMDKLDGANHVALTGATVESDPGVLFGAEAGLTAMVAKNIALFADVGVTSGLDNSVSGVDGQGGVKLYW